MANIGSQTQQSVMSLWSQYFPPAPTLTPEHIGPQSGKVFLITGGASGVGFELCSMLYAAGGTVYLAGRSEDKALTAIAEIEQSCQYHKGLTRDASSSGVIRFLRLDLCDLKTIALAAKEFNRQEPRLDVLWNNEGIGATFNGETAPNAQGKLLPVQLVANCIGPLLLTKLLQPALQRAETPRVVWTGSAVVDFQAPKGGMSANGIEDPGSDGIYNYTLSKVGNWFLASELARRETERVQIDSSLNPVLHIAVNPGNLRTPVWRAWSWLFVKILSMTLLHDARFGAYSELWAGLSPELTPEQYGGSYVVPWGRRHPSPRADILESLKSREKGGTGLAARFYEWCERQTAGL